jgi:hypothetical protein
MILFLEGKYQFEEFFQQQYTKVNTTLNTFIKEVLFTL